MVKQFKQEDDKNIQSIANNYCSHQEGWVEKVPGTCDAGGPPPICPVDHWKRVSRQEAMAVLSAQLRKVTAERARRMSDIQERAENNLCSCWVNEMKRQDERAIAEPSSGSAFDAGYRAASLPPQSSIKITCMGGCPGMDLCRWILRRNRT